MQFPKNFQNTRIHCVGIKGTGMSSLVEVLANRGAKITGSDVADVFYTDAILQKHNIKPLLFSEKNIDEKIDFVIYSSAYNFETNPDLREAKQKNIPCILYTEALGELSKLSYSVGICGVHGKTTTTGMVGTILNEINLPSQTLAGSVITSFGNTSTLTTKSFNLENQKNYFVAETCEYQKHFMAFHPEKIILTSVESDHQDFYPTFESIQNAFVDYLCSLPKNGEVIFCFNDFGARETVSIAKQKRSDLIFTSYGENENCDWKITFGKIENEMQTFSLENVREKICENFSLSVPGIHEVLDATAAIALCVSLLKTDGKNPHDYILQMQAALKKFRGGARRSEIVGRAKFGKNDVLFIDDYAHHPTAIKTTLAGFREFYKGRKIIVDFMSHTYSRTASLLKEFAASFDSADEIILHKIYSSARENKNDFSVTGETLFLETKKNYEKVFYFEEIMDAKNFLIDELKKDLDEKFSGLLFVTMGAGDNWKLGKAILDEAKV